MKPFGLFDPLPQGTTVLEASAGTGKTFTIAALAVRFLAEGVSDIGDLLLITFSRAASAELRSRVRERVQASAEALAQAARGVPPADPLDRWLADADEAEVGARAARLAKAFTHFDRATIMTTHEFCHAMIRGLGVLAAQEPTSRLVEDLTPFADEVASDVYLQRYAHDDRLPPFPFLDPESWGKRTDTGGRSIAREAVRTPGTLGPLDASGAVRERVDFATEVRAEVERRLRRRRLYSFDHQLTRLDAALTDPVTGELAAAKLARRFPVVMVDEFQDTDPVQWRILRTAFGGQTGSRLVLIGDPKQAIYRFRGADIHAYTGAVGEADATTTLTTNYRSDRPVVDAVGALFRGVGLGERIDVPDVAAHRGDSQLDAAGRPWSAGVQVRCVEAEQALPPWVAQRRIANDLVAVVAELLAPGAPLRRSGGPLLASDIAVLVRSNRRGRALAEALAAAGIPASFSGTASVFASDAAVDWITLLTALNRPRGQHVRHAVLTPFLGGSVAALATASDADHATWALLIHTWARTLALHGVWALLAQMDADTAFTPRLLATPDGERQVTDHRHIAELIHGKLADPATRLDDVITWLSESVDESASNERTRRMETDELAVQIMTIHRAKGRQFPIVLLPEASYAHGRDDDTGEVLDLPAPADRIIDVGGRGHRDRPANRQLAALEQSDEDLRTLYVGLTRAQSHAIAWWAHDWNVTKSPLHRLVHADHAPGSRRPAADYPAISPHGLDWLEPAGIATVAVPDQPPAAAPTSPKPHGELRARSWHRVIDHAWRRTSYSGLTAGVHDDALLDDEPPVDVTVAADPALGQPSPMALLPGGTAFGTLVHTVFETVDARGADWQEQLRAHCADALGRWPLPGVDAAHLADALAPAFTTPLGPLAPAHTLRDFGPGNRLSELDFEFPMASDRVLGDVADLLRPSLAGTPLASYPDRLATPGLAGQTLRGFLTGSIDAVLRLPSGAHLVVDYKTNRLGEPGLPVEELTLGHYAPAALAEAMMASHYPLQALLYSVALHRFLATRWRGYEPAQHLGGAIYLFVRGMAGPDTPQVAGSPTGVFSWRPQPAVVAAVSTLLAGGAL